MCCERMVGLEINPRLKPRMGAYLGQRAGS